MGSGVMGSQEPSIVLGLVGDHGLWQPVLPRLRARISRVLWSVFVLVHSIAVHYPAALRLPGNSGGNLSLSQLASLRTHEVFGSSLDDVNYGPIRCKLRLGELLKNYYREEARRTHGWDFEARETKLFRNNQN